MCGKFTAMASWENVVDFSQPLVRAAGEDGGGNDEIRVYRVNTMLPVIVWDAGTRTRRVVHMRWGFPDPKDLNDWGGRVSDATARGRLCAAPQVDLAQREPLMNDLLQYLGSLLPQ